MICNVAPPPCPTNCGSCTYTTKTCEMCPTAVCVDACSDCPIQPPVCGEGCLECAVTSRTCEVCPYATCLSYQEPVPWPVKSESFAAKFSKVKYIKNEFQWHHVLSTQKLIEHDPNQNRGITFSLDRKTPFPAYIVGFVSSPADDGAAAFIDNSATVMLQENLKLKIRAPRSSLLDKINVPGFQGIAIISNSLMVVEKGQVAMVEAVPPHIKQVRLWINSENHIEVYLDAQKVGYEAQQRVDFPVNVVFGSATPGVTLDEFVWINTPFSSTGI